MPEESDQLNIVDQDAGPSAALRLLVYAAFFATGTSALVFEVLWSRFFVTVLGAGTYAISIVLCAFMAGLGLGSWLGGRLADRFRNPLLVYGLIEGLVALWALLVPAATSLLTGWAPGVLGLVGQSTVAAVASRFVISFVILVVPCAFMGATLPLLTRFCAASSDVIGARVSLLYGVNTLGATAGCFAAGYWMVGTLGLRLTNLAAVGLTLVVAVGATAFALLYRRRQRARDVPAREAVAGPDAPSVSGGLLLAVAFAAGLAGLSCEVLWVRYLGPLNNLAYAFTTILGIYLLGVGLGGLVCRLALARVRRPVRALGIVQSLLALCVIACFVTGAMLSIRREAGPLSLVPMAAITVFAPTILMGVSFPLLCAAYTRSVATAGRGVGAVYAVNTVGAMVGALLPTFVLVPLLGVQAGLIIMALLYWSVGMVLLLARGGFGPARCLPPLAATLVVAAALFGLVPSDLGRSVVLSTNQTLRRHRDIIFYEEGRTSTEIIVRDRVAGIKYLYMNGAIEVTTGVTDVVSFKLMGGLGPLLHSRPDDVLMVCFGSGMASGVAAQYPEVRTVRAVDLERMVLKGAELFADENHSILTDPKFTASIDDGRNYVYVSGRNWPVIVSDSLHPKSSDSWLLYTAEFYRTMRDHLTEDGIFVQWVPFQGLSETEFKSIVGTFQSVFPHTSLWFAHGVARNGLYYGYTLLVATPESLSIDVPQLRSRLAAPAVSADMRPYALDTVTGLLETFVCGEDRLRAWTHGSPINTDDLPYIQYTTKYTDGPDCVESSFAPLLESAWPYLTNVGEGPEADRLRADLDLRVRANGLMFRRRFAEAIALLPQDPKYAGYRRNLELAVDWIRDVAAYYPDSAFALAILAGRAMRIPGNWGQAADLYERAVSLDPDDPALRQNLGLAMAKQWDFESAISHYRAALDLDPASAVTYSNLGAALAAVQRLDEAEDALAEALLLDPSLTATRRNLGIVLLRQERFEEAAAQLGEALQRDPTDEETRRYLGMALSRTPFEAAAR